MADLTSNHESQHPDCPQTHLPHIKDCPYCKALHAKWGTPEQIRFVLNCAKDRKRAGEEMMALPLHVDFIIAVLDRLQVETTGSPDETAHAAFERLFGHPAQHAEVGWVAGYACALRERGAVKTEGSRS